MTDKGFWILYLIYAFTVIVKSPMWQKKRDALRELVTQASADDIRHYRSWEWRTEYWRSHGSIWGYAYIPWRKFDDCYPEKHFITPGVDEHGRKYEVVR
jgi:hypothetical protein